MNLAGVILAAGASRRMGTPKALLDYRGQTFLDRLVALFSPHCTQVVVVLGHHADTIRARTRLPPNAAFVENPDPDRGMLSSLQTAVHALHTVDVFLFTPVDIPAISPELVARALVPAASALVPAPARDDAPLLVIPRHQGHRGHPVLCAASLIPEFLALPATAKPSDIIHKYAARTFYLDVADPAILADVDLPEDYRRLLA